MWQIDDVAALHVEINQLVGVFYLLDIEDNWLTHKRIGPT
jgi:hypothetical protein